MSLIYSIILRLLPLMMVLFMGIVFALPSAKAQTCSGWYNCVLLGNAMSVQAYVNDGQDVNMTSSSGLTALHWAAERGHFNVVTVLLTAGANINIKNNRGLTPLYMAISANSPAIISILVSAGVNVNEIDARGNSYLHHAVYLDHAESVRALLSLTVNVNHLNNPDSNWLNAGGSSPLHWAAYYNRGNIITILLSATAFINHRGENGRTPLHWAAYRGHIEAATILLSAGANINQTTDYGWTSVDHVAADSGSNPSALISALLEKGAKPTRENSCRIIMQVFADNACHPCPSGQEYNFNNACHPTQSSCNNNNQIRINGACQSCDQFETRSGNTCQPTQASCNAKAQRYEGGSCISCPSGRHSNTNNECILIPPSSDDGGNVGLYIGLGVVALGGLYLFTSTDIIGTYNFSPTYHYELNDNGYSYRAGLQGDYVTDNWHLYYAVDSSDSDNELRYSTGIAYSSDLWGAAFNEEIKGDNVDYDFLLSTKISRGNWEFSPIYTLHSRHENLSTNWQTETNNSLNFQGMWHNTNWTLKSSADFQWESTDEFGDKGQFNLLLMWQF